MARDDFKGVALAALHNLSRLVAQWLPDGHLRGAEWVARNPTRNDNKPGSFQINVASGVWCDFATGDRGNDAISLYAYIQGMRQVDAMKAVAMMVGYQLEGHVGGNTGTSAPRSPAPRPPAPDLSVVTKRKTNWLPLRQVPEGAGSYPKAHYARGIPQAVWEYRSRNGTLQGCVMRFVTSDGGKETLPCTWARNIDTGKEEWRFLAFSEPRPLYLATPDNSSKPVLVVEGEKCAQAASRVPEIAAEFDVVTWPGGSKAVGKSDWSELQNRRVVIWPDSDRKLDKAGNLMPFDIQPGMRAALEIADICRRINAQPQILNIPDAHQKPDGWDIADAIAEGWTAAQLLTVINQKPAPTGQAAQATEDPGYDTARFVKKPKFVYEGRRGSEYISGCLANVVEMLTKHVDWAGCIRLNDFSGEIDVVARPPYIEDDGTEWKTRAWHNEDDTDTCVWLQRNGIKVTLQNVVPAIKTVAKEFRWHPVREYVQSLQWDGVSRVQTWLNDFAAAGNSEYVKAVSTFFLVGMVKRVFEPGCKFDYALIFEGLQGLGKSRLFAALGGQWFSDTDLDLNNKDALSALAGNWLHEFAELSSFSRADQNKIKSFLSRQVDEYRPVYERRHIKAPRQIVFCGSTNEMEYFDDPTGARRFWPVRCNGRLDPDGLAKVRDQLFAEAYQLYLAGQRCYPTPAQQAALFDPEQIRRQRSDPLEEPIREFLEEKQDAVNEEFTMDNLLEKIFSSDRSKWAPTASVRVGKILARLGCAKVERRLAEHRHVYKPPKKSATDSSDAQAYQGEGPEYEVPF